MSIVRSVRTRVLLVSVLIAVVLTVTGGSLLIVRDRVRRHVEAELSSDLTQSLSTFENLQRQLRESLTHENALLADLPTLKALMTTNDRATIADGAVRPWKLAGGDLFALADSHTRVMAVFTRETPPGPELTGAVEQIISRPAQHYLSSGGRLFDIAVRPLYFGDEVNGSLLGYVVTGYRIDTAVLSLISHASEDDAAFFSGGQIVASTLPHALQQELTAKRGRLGTGGHVAEVELGGKRYLATDTDLSAESLGDLKLVILKSFEPAEESIREINRLVVLLGVGAVVLGSLLMIVLSRIVTKPLETLAQGVKAFGLGDPKHRLPENGTREVLELSDAFGRMRDEIQASHRALLDAERLATIGSMASSVSHDLRHYLAAVFANAEFLSSSKLNPQERGELLSDIQVAVDGATELLDSLLILSKGGAAFHREPGSVLRIAEKAVSLLRSHPEAEGITLRLECDDDEGASALVDAKQMQRAIYNLLLNACQSAHTTGGPRVVVLSIAGKEQTIAISVTDSGPGVPDHIRASLFQPFVSDGKQSGTGLGLTLADAVAREHGGTVTLVSSKPGETVFRLTLQRALSGKDAKLASGR
ncbi:HAMP domain-containing protein [Acidobacteria bacterium AB60]|nr:HAMP domain-containing protein [Acidobacteria bacterium AB60]